MKNAVIFLCGLMAGLLIQYNIQVWEASEAVSSTDKVSGVKVKRSLTGLCHPKGSQFFDYVKFYTEYDSLNQCILEGGKLPLRVRDDIRNQHNSVAVNTDSSTVQ